MDQKESVADIYSTGLILPLSVPMFSLVFSGSPFLMGCGDPLLFWGATVEWVGRGGVPVEISRSDLFGPRA